MNAEEVLDALERYFADPYLFLREVRVGTGYGNKVEQRIDAWAIHPWPSEHYVTHAMEVKVSRADWNRELRNPIKRIAAMTLCDFFWIVTPVGIVKREELPPGVGLMEVVGGERGVIHKLVEAPMLDRPEPNWGFTCSLIRAAMRGNDLMRAAVKKGKR